MMIPPARPFIRFPVLFANPGQPQGSVGVSADRTPPALRLTTQQQLHRRCRSMGPRQASLADAAASEHPHPGRRARGKSRSFDRFARIGADPDQSAPVIIGAHLAFRRRKDWWNVLTGRVDPRLRFRQQRSLGEMDQERSNQRPALRARDVRRATRRGGRVADGC